MPIVANANVVSAEVAAELGKHSTAAWMLGAAERVRGGADRTDARLARFTASLQATLGGGFAASYAEGRGVDRETAKAALDPSSLPVPDGTAR